MLSVQELQDISNQIRRDALRMTHGAKSGHPGGSLGCADFFAVLYFHIMKHDNRFNMDGKNEDIFMLSNGHISPGWYSALARAGYFNIAELSTFRKINSRLQGHPATHERLPGIRIASGSLGQGLSVAIGAALTKRLNNDKHLVFSLHGDGEIQEGQIWEAAMFAAARKVDNLISTIDYNGQQIDGPVSEIMPLGNLKAKWEAFGWKTIEMDGNHIPDVISTLEEAKKHTFQGYPIAIIMKTSMGKGVNFMTDNYKWHGVAPNDEQLKDALSQIKETIGDY